MRTLIQVPDGLKRKALDIADKTGNAIICAEPCYGGCDLREREAVMLGCKKIIHVGHSKFLKNKLPVEYMEEQTDADPLLIIDREFEKIDCYDNIGIVASLQFVELIGKVRKELEKRRKHVFVGRAKGLRPGQILGCNTAAARAIEKDVDCFLIISSGKFHALGLAMATSKPVIVLDIEQGTIADMFVMKQMMLKQRYAAIALAKDAEKFGILISTKPGQVNVKLAEQIKKKISAVGKKAYMLAMDEIKPEKLIGFGLDAYICTACPRIAIENRTAFNKPILNPDEFEQIFK
ncbi:MAG: diphthamide biosynthesis enzyme Dph2 [Candidatus Aenigmatarchaeota archaeon]